LNNVSEWVAALLLIAVILFIFLISGVLVTSLFIIVCIFAVVGWVSSLFPSTKEKGKREEESDGSSQD